MRIYVDQPRAAALLLCGVPWPAGALPPAAGVRVHAGAQELPAWWQARAWWPDGSVRWLWLHTRLTDRADALTVSPGDREPPTLGGELANGLRLGDWQLQTQAGALVCHTPTTRLRLQPEPPGFTPALAPPVMGPLEWVEPSALAPLLRWRGATAGGVALDCLLRLDPVGGCLYWQQRASLLAPEPRYLRSLGLRLQTDAGPWAVLGPQGEHAAIELPRPGWCRYDDGPEQAGTPVLTARCGALSGVLDKAWQRAPCAVRTTLNGADFALYPVSAPPLPVQPGTSFRHRLWFTWAVFDRAPMTWHLDPEQACATGCCGPLVARTARSQRWFPGYEQALEAGLQGARMERLESAPGAPAGRAAALADEAGQDPAYFGLPHYGDWPMALGAYGTRRRMYADNEYDTPYALYLHFLRTGTWIYGDTAYHSAVHMADIDARVTDGDLLYHGYHDQAEDHGAHRPPNGDLGHYWTDGLVLTYLLHGDLWAWEAALALGQRLSRVFAGDGDDAIRRHFSGCERTVGWPLTALAGLAEVRPEPALRALMARMAAFLARFTADPDRELEDLDQADGQPLTWWRVCQQDGCKPFMLGVVLEGLERYHRLTADPAAAAAVIALCRFLVDVMWVPGIEAFRYEWNAFNRAHREDVYPHYINAMVAPGLAYGYQLSGEPQFREVATRAFHASLWTLFAPGGGKEIGMVGRTSAVMVARLCQWQEQDRAARAARLPPSVGQPFCFRGVPADLAHHRALHLRAGQPGFDAAGGLHAVGDSYAVYAFHDPASSDRGQLAFTFIPDAATAPAPYPVAARAYLHLSDRGLTRSCVSVISFYAGLHVRFYDAERHYIEVLETDISHWQQGQTVRVRVAWDAAAATAALWVDGAEVDRRPLLRRLGGAFQRLHLGHRPGNWRAEGRLVEVELDLG